MGAIKYLPESYNSHYALMFLMFITKTHYLKIKRD